MTAAHWLLLSSCCLCIDGLNNGVTTGVEGWINEKHVQAFAFPPADDTQVFVCGLCVGLLATSMAVAGAACLSACWRLLFIHSVLVTAATTCGTMMMRLLCAGADGAVAVAAAGGVL